jgi:uncharacterized protein YbaA (DUF1428 family)
MNYIMNKIINYVWKQIKCYIVCIWIVCKDVMNGKILADFQKNVKSNANQGKTFNWCWYIFFRYINDTTSSEWQTRKATTVIQLSRQKFMDLIHCQLPIDGKGILFGLVKIVDRSVADPDDLFYRIRLLKKSGSGSGSWPK